MRNHDVAFSPYEVTKMIKISVKISSESRRLLTLANECSASVQTRRMAFADGGEGCKAPPAGKRRLWEKNQSKTRVFMVYYRSKRRTSILIILRPTTKKAP